MTNTGKLLVTVVVLLVAGGIWLFYTPTPAPSGEVQPSGQTQTPTTPAPATPKTTAKTLNVVFGIKDKAPSIEGIQAVVMHVKEISVLTPKRGWVPVISEPKSFDLLQLKKEGALQLLSEIYLEPGTYSQIRFLVDTVLVTQNNVPRIAKLPSGELKMLTHLVVEQDQTSAVTFDFLLDKSLHIAGNGQYIFAPVINLKTFTGVQIQRFGKKVDVIGGVGKFTGDLGMDEAGNFGANVSLDSNANLEVVSDIIVVIPSNINRANLPVSVEVAIAAALNKKYADKVLSVKATTYFDRVVWRVLGAKNSGTVKVYVDGMIGEVIGVEY